jgi:uncharacterized membrane protein
MRQKRPSRQDRPTVVRVAVAGVFGVVVGVVVGVVAAWRYAPAAGWSAASAVLVGWTWLVIAHMSAEQTKVHATREDPARALTDLIVLIASVASLAGVVYLLAAGSGGHGAAEAVGAGLGILSVAGAWAVVHTVFTLRYALLYYAGSPGGIDSNQSERNGDAVAFELGALQRHEAFVHAEQSGVHRDPLGLVGVVVVVVDLSDFAEFVAIAVIGGGVGDLT